MIQPSGCVDGKDGGRLSMSNMVGPWVVDREADDVVDVEVMHSAGVDGDVNNQLRSFGKRGVVVKEHLCWG